MSPFSLTNEKTCAVQFADNFDFFETEIEDEVELIEFDKIKANEYFGCVLADNLKVKIYKECTSLTPRS